MAKRRSVGLTSGGLLIAVIGFGACGRTADDDADAMAGSSGDVSGGEEPTGGGGLAGGAATGGTGEGSGSNQLVPSALGTLGEPCTPNGALGCSGHAQTGQLICEDGEWSPNGTCSGDLVCDTRAGGKTGSCQPILEECLDLEPGDSVPVCDGARPQRCGPDLTTLVDDDACATDEVCIEGSCEQDACVDCQPVVPECEGKLPGDVVCGADGMEHFECGPDLLTKENVVACDAGLACSDGVCVPPSCVELAATCGPQGDDNCCTSPLVVGGDFLVGAEASYPAAVSSFRLDKYEVTVGRFRKFVAAMLGGWLPAAGSGKHAHLNDGAGLANDGSGHEVGWSDAWNIGDVVYGLYSGASNADEWDSSLSGTNATWTSTAGANEELPINQVNWYQSAAFCIWDGGFLPSETEWEYAAVGGSQERTYPWGSTTPGMDHDLLVYDCAGGGIPGDCTFADILPVGSMPDGNGRWLQSDLAGSMQEWTFDRYYAHGASCQDCAIVPGSGPRVVRDGGWQYSAVGILLRAEIGPTSRIDTLGFRCARSP
jgi:formylglycine-generating enzyme